MRQGGPGYPLVYITATNRTAARRNCLRVVPEAGRGAPANPFVKDGCIEQADGTAWTAQFSWNMTELADTILQHAGEDYGGTMLAEIDLSNPSQFLFKMIGGEENDPGLKFIKG